MHGMYILVFHYSHNTQIVSVHNLVLQKGTKGHILSTSVMTGNDAVVENYNSNSNSNNK